MNKKLFALLAALLVSGCATPVPQSLTPPLVPKSFTGPVVASASVWPDAQWWKGFGDPELSDLIAKAQSDNRDLAVAAARVTEAAIRSNVRFIRDALA